MTVQCCRFPALPWSCRLCMPCTLLSYLQSHTIHPSLSHLWLDPYYYYQSPTFWLLQLDITQPWLPQRFDQARSSRTKSSFSFLSALCWISTFCRIQLYYWPSKGARNTFDWVNSLHRWNEIQIIRFVSLIYSEMLLNTQF